MQGRAIGLDVGTKTIGIALSDPLGMLARPHSTLSRQSVNKDAAALLLICQEEKVEHLVVGLPLELDDSEARPCKLARQVGDALAELLGVQPRYVDERYTSVDAEEILVRQDMSRKKRKRVIDQVAAVLILQTWLDHGEEMVERPPR